MSRISTYECKSKDKFAKELIPIIFLIDLIRGTLMVSYRSYSLHWLLLI